jgi:hypothetical protein
MAAIVGVEIVHVAIDDADFGKFADIQVMAIGDVHQAIDIGRIALRAGDGALLVDLVDQHLDAAVDHALEALGGDVFLVAQQARLALLAHLVGQRAGQLVGAAPATGE